MHIKKGDTVEILTGESRGQRGRVVKIMPREYKAFVEGEGIKKATKHSKPTTANPQGGIVHTDIAIHLSNLMLVDGKGNKTKITRNKVDGKSVRISKKSQEEI
ncbi:MAG: 50S ribosomal protein L24 [Vicingaceae bacterium]